MRKNFDEDEDSDNDDDDFDTEFEGDEEFDIDTGTSSECTVGEVDILILMQTHLTVVTVSHQHLLSP